MKLEYGLKGSFKPLGFVTPLYVELPEIGNDGPITRKEFAKKIELCTTSMSPKHVQIPQDISTKEVAKYFEPIISKNGHSTFELWMIGLIIDNLLQ